MAKGRKYHKPYSVSCKKHSGLLSLIDCPRIPSRTVKYRKGGKHGKSVYRTRPTEFHTAISSFGRINYTSRLSDEEFVKQAMEEAGYVSSCIAYSALSAADHMVNIFRWFFRLFTD